MLILIVILASVCADMISKYLTVQLLLPLGREVVVIPYLINFSYVENRGAAFGILADKRWVFMILSVVFITALIIFAKKSKITHPLFSVSIGMIIGGGVGNMIDRIFIGYVVDFIRATFIDFPVFNIADSCVVVGVILFMVYVLFVDKSFLASKKEVNDK